MNQDDLIYLLSNLSNVCNVPIRIYLDKEDDIGYIITDDFFYYAYIKYLNYHLIIGPSRLIKPDDKIITKMGIELNLNKEEIDSFIPIIKSINNLPIETILKSLCMINFILTGNKKNYIS